MVDFFLLLLLPGAGDELQGIKRGIIEMADLILDQQGRRRQPPARRTGPRWNSRPPLHFLQPATPGWKTEAALCSARTGEGIPQVWERIEQFYQRTGAQGRHRRRRQQQALDWLADLIRDELQRRFYHDPRVQARLPGIAEAVAARRNYRRSPPHAPAGGRSTAPELK